MQIENIYKEGIAVPFIIYDKNTQSKNILLSKNIKHKY